jgi:hypothetical protein
MGSISLPSLTQRHAPAPLVEGILEEDDVVFRLVYVDRMRGKPKGPGMKSTSFEADADERTPTSDSSRRCSGSWARQAIPASAGRRAKYGPLL